MLVLFINIVEFVWCDVIFWIRVCVVVIFDSIDIYVLIFIVVVFIFIYICGKKVIIFLLFDGVI